MTSGIEPSPGGVQRAFNTPHTGSVLWFLKRIPDAKIFNAVTRQRASIA